MNTKIEATANAPDLQVDGTHADGNLAGDGANSPFYVFDVTKQLWIAGPFGSRAEAETALRVESAYRA